MPVEKHLIIWVLCLVVLSVCAAGRIHGKNMKKNQNKTKNI